MAFPSGDLFDVLTGARTKQLKSGQGYNVYNPNGTNFFVPWGAPGPAGPGIGDKPLWDIFKNREQYLQGERSQGTPQAGAPTAMGGNQMLSPYLDQGVANNYGYGPMPTAVTSGGGAPGGGGVPNMNQFASQVTAPVWNPPGVPAPGSPLGPPTKQGKVTYSPVGDQEKLLDMLFRGSVTGQGGGPIGSQLFNMALGQLPPALAEQLIGQTNEQFGKMGARFGTDLGTAISRGLAQASESQSLNAIRQILGLGGTTAGFQFQRGESGLDRAMQEFIAQQQNDPMMGLIQALLGGGIG